MKKFDYDKFISTSSKVAVLCRTFKEAEEFGQQMNIRRQYTILNNRYKEHYDEHSKPGIVFTNDGHYGFLNEIESYGLYNIYDFTTGLLISWKRGTKRPNDYCYHKDVVDYTDYVFENQLYRVIYYKRDSKLRNTSIDIRYVVKGYIDNFNPADKIAIRDKNNLLYCIDYKLITLIEPIKEEENNGRY